MDGVGKKVLADEKCPGQFVMPKMVAQAIVLIKMKFAEKTVLLTQDSSETIGSLAGHPRRVAGNNFYAGQ